MTSPVGRTLPAPPVRLRARRPQDLLALVPYLLGFQPAESLVAVLVRGTRVVLSARIDLPGPADEDPAPCVQDLVDQHAPTALVLVVYSSDRRRAETLLTHYLASVSGVAISDALLVDGQRWWSLTCRSGCCPAEGTPYAPASHPLAAEAVFAGLTAATSRAEVASQVAGPPSEQWDQVRRLAEQLREPWGREDRAARGRRVASEVVEALARDDPASADRLDQPVDLAASTTPELEPSATRPRPVASSPSTSSPSTADSEERRLIRLALLVQDVSSRDVACALITREQAQAHRALWHQVVARVPPELAAAPLCLLGLAAWAAGEGTLLNCCGARVRALDPTYSMGQLLVDLSTRALPPSFWDVLAADLRRELGLLAG